MVDNKYKEFIEKCHPELKEEAEKYVKNAYLSDWATKAAKREAKERCEARDKQEVRKRVPWYKFPFSYKERFGDTYEATDTSNVSFVDAFKKFTEHCWGRRFSLVIDRESGPRSQLYFNGMLSVLHIDEDTFMERYMEFLYDKDSIDYIKDMVDDDNVETDDMCWDGSLFAYKKSEMADFMKKEIKKMTFSW